MLPVAAPTGVSAHPRHSAHAIRDQAYQAIDAARMVAGRFALYQFANQRNRVILFLPRVLKKAIHHLFYLFYLPTSSLPVDIITRRCTERELFVCANPLTIPNGSHGH